MTNLTHLFLLWDVLAAVISGPNVYSVTLCFGFVTSSRIVSKILQSLALLYSCHPWFCTVQKKLTAYYMLGHKACVVLLKIVTVVVSNTSNIDPLSSRNVNRPRR